MIRNLLGLSKEPLELEISEAAEQFRKQKNDELENADRRADSIRSDVIDEFEQLEENLEEMKGFRDPKDRQVVNDVVDNIISERLEMIEELSFPEDPRKLQTELDDFIQNFQSLKQKEATVLEEAYLQKEISRSIEGLEDQRQILDKFLDKEYSIVISYQKLKQQLDRRDNLLEQLDELREQIHQLEVDNLKSEIEEIDNKLEELENSSKWGEYRFLQDEVEQKKSEKQDLMSDLKTSVSKMERGLKKLIYQVRNGDVSVNNIETLEKLQDNETDYFLEKPEKTAEAAREAEESLPADLLNSKQQLKFREAVDEVEELPEKAEKIDSLKSEIDKLENQIKNHSVLQEKDQLESKRKAIKNRLKDEKEDKNRLDQKIQNIESEIDETESEILQILEDSFDRKIKIEKEANSSS